MSILFPPGGGSGATIATLVILGSLVLIVISLVANAALYIINVIAYTGQSISQATQNISGAAPPQTYTVAIYSGNTTNQTTLPSPVTPELTPLASATAQLLSIIGSIATNPYILAMIIAMDIVALGFILLQR